MTVWMPGDDRPKCDTEDCKNISRARGADCRRCYMAKKMRHYRLTQTGYGDPYKRSEHLRLKYGVDQEWFMSKLGTQAGRCAICLTDQPGGRGVFHIDHCHTTGRVRGLLCAPCNLGLGHFRDDKSALEAAIDYLSHHESPLSTDRE